jgi:hypothetical protein
MRRGTLNQLDSLVDIEERTAAVLVLRVGNPDNQFIEDPSGTKDDVEVSRSDGVEGSRNNPALHEDPSPFS